MIIVRRLNGEEFGLNSDLIETIDETPDTTIHMVNKRVYIVKESKEEIVDLIVQFKQRCFSKFIEVENREDETK